MSGLGSYSQHIVKIKTNYMNFNSVKLKWTKIIRFMPVSISPGACLGCEIIASISKHYDKIANMCAIIF